MKCFFDGSAIALETGHSWLTLAGFMAGDGFWREFDKAWLREVLNHREPRAPYLHMRELISGKGPFKGWEQERRNRLVLDAVMYLQSLPKKSFCAVISSIDTTARDGLVAKGCKIGAAHYILGHWNITKAFSWYYDTWPERLEIAHVYFDQDEPFMHPFRQRWLKEMKSQKVIITNTFWGAITKVEQLDMRSTSALQASDLIAWAESRHRASTVDRPYRHLAKMIESVIPTWRLILDHDTLERKHCEDSLSN